MEFFYFIKNLLRRILPNRVNSRESIKVFYVTHYFPGFSGFYGSGANILLERLIITLKRLYPKKYFPVLYLTQRKEKNNTTVYPFEIIEDIQKNQLLSTVEQNNSEDTILHLGTTYLLEHSELFTPIVSKWKGPIIQRVTLMSKIQDLQNQMGTRLHNYLKEVDVLISQSDSMTKEILTYGFPQEKIVQIENGIDTEHKRAVSEKEKFILRKKYHPYVDPKATIFFFAGRLNDPVKRAVELLETWLSSGLAKKNCYLILAGNFGDLDDYAENPLALFLKNYSSEQLRQQHILFTGYVHEHTLVEYYKIADIYVSASEREGFSNAVLEALVFSLPVIARSGVSGYEHMIVERETGIFFDTREELSQKMTELLDNPTLRRRMGKKGRLRVEKYFSIEKMVEKYKELYVSLLQKKLNKVQIKDKERKMRAL